MVVDSLSPTIDHVLTSIGASGDPAMKMHARVMAAAALKKYDPAAGAAIPTYISSQLQALRRTRRDIQSAVPIPDRVQTDSMHLRNAEQELFDALGRKPDTGELADHTGMSHKRIEKIRKAFIRTPSESDLGDASAESSNDYNDEALRYVYHDSDHTDRRIIELKTGYGGNPVTSHEEIGKALKLTPSQLSRRSTRITLRHNELADALTSTT